jgi:DNA polymerase I
MKPAPPFRDTWDPSRFVSFDLETWKVQPGLPAPPMVCGAAAYPDGTAWLIRSGVDRRADRQATRQGFAALLESDRIIVGCLLPFDFLVMAVEAQKHDGVDLMPLIFDKHAQHQLFDVARAEELHAVAEGTLGKDPRTGMPLKNRSTGKTTNKYSLDTCVDLVLGRRDAKINDKWRRSYALLDDLPIDEWPLEAQQYPVDDVVNALDVAVEQVRRNRNLTILGAKCYQSWSLWLAAAWGLRTDPVLVEVIERAALAGQVANRPTFVSAGFLRDDGSEDQGVVKRAVAKAYGCTGSCPACGGSGKVHNKFSKKDPTKPVGKPINCTACSATGLDLSTGPVPMTEPSEKFPAGQVKSGRDVLVESGDEVLVEYGAYQEDDKITSTYVPFLRKGIDRPIDLSPNPILKSLRVSYDGVVQLLPRGVSARLADVLRDPELLAEVLRDLGLEGVAPLGVRDCIVARPGKVFYSVDDTGGELVTFAESAYNRVGFSKMGEALVAGIEVHSDFAAFVMGVPYDEFIARKKEPRFKAFRQAAKPPNFGFPGGMSDWRLVLQQREQGPDTPHPSGPSSVWDGRAFVRGYKGLRFCVLLERTKRCGETKVTEWNDRAGPPTCLECLKVAKELKAAWIERWSEAPLYLKWHSNNSENKGSVEHVYSGHTVGGAGYCDSANGDFQTLLAVINMQAQCRVSEEQYCDRRSPLYGSRSITFQHDELFGECDERRGHEVCERVDEIMVEEWRKGCPVHAKACKAERTTMRRWFKQGEPVWRDGRLVPWAPAAA